MRTFYLAIFFISCSSYAEEVINCYFDKFHQANHQDNTLTGYVQIKQSLEINNGTTSDATRKLDGKYRASNSVKWVVFKPFGVDRFPVYYAGDFGELLTLENEAGTDLKSSNDWYKASIVSSIGINTHTHLGKCFVSQNK
jgi:hypothetical protein